MNYIEAINEGLARRVGLQKLYPFAVVHDLRDHRGRPLGGYADCGLGQVVLCGGMSNPSRIVGLYLHEAGHLVANAAGIDHDPAGRTHNRYFAALVATMYRRAGILDQLKIYDFADGQEYQNGELPPEALSVEGMADGAELVERFRYIVHRSAELAASRLTVEAAARKIYREDVFLAWTGRSWAATATKKATWWPVMAAGAAVGLFIGLWAWFGL